MHLTGEGFLAYLSGCREGTADRLVLGHTAPDGDAVLSSLFEAWRLTVAGIPAVPWVPAEALPREVAWLLGQVAPLVPVGEVPDRPDTRYVLTDHHHDPVRQLRVERVVDHHLPVTPLAVSDTCIAPVGATVTLVSQCLRQDGHTVDKQVARWLLGGILLDTDGLSPHKAKEADVAEAEALVAVCGEDVASFYAALQGELLSETDIATLYRRDYRTYYAADGRLLAGFAILKVWENASPDPTELRRLLEADAAEKGCPVCVAKVMTFTPAGRGPQTYYAAGPQADRFLKELVAAEGTDAVPLTDRRVTLPVTCPGRGRKWVAAHLLPRLEETP